MDFGASLGIFGTLIHEVDHFVIDCYSLMASYKSHVPHFRLLAWFYED